MLRPLEQWYCDYCEELIERPEDGYYECLRDPKTGVKTGFKIVHHASASPREKGSNQCYHYAHEKHRSDMPLMSVLGGSGKGVLLSILGTGICPHDPSTDPDARNYREFMDFFRRVQVPYYEEARVYFSAAIAEGMLESFDSDSVDDPGFLKRVIERFRQGQG